MHIKENYKSIPLKYRYLPMQRLTFINSLNQVIFSKISTRTGNANQTAK